MSNYLPTTSVSHVLVHFKQFISCNKNLKIKNTLADGGDGDGGSDHEAGVDYAGLHLQTIKLVLTGDKEDDGHEGGGGDYFSMPPLPKADGG